MLGAHLKVKAGEAGLVATNRFWTGIHKKVQRLTDSEGQGDGGGEDGAYEAPSSRTPSRSSASSPSTPWSSGSSGRCTSSSWRGFG